MSVPLPSPIAAYIDAANAHDSAALAATFAEDAVVTDDGGEHRGRPAIQAWNAENVRAYAMTMTVTESERAGDEVSVTARVSGTFPGAPLLFRFAFWLRGEEITRLQIEHIG